jgi:hypothetical protein
MTDLRGPLPEKPTCPHSISGILARGNDTKLFSYMLELSGLQGLYDSPEADFTLFVVPDGILHHLEGSITNMDRSTARHIIQSSTLRRRIIAALLEDSPAAYFYTEDKPNQLFVTNMNNTTYVNNDAVVVRKDIHANNGVIHHVDKLVIPYIR